MNFVATLTAKNPTTGDQITRYVYGGGKAWLASQVYRNDLLAAEIYPDSTNFEDASGILQNGTSGVVDRVEFQYNRLGERMAKRDQNGTVHTYDYDNLGRLLHDRVTTFGTNVDTAVKRISTAYDVIGNVKSVTSYDNATVGSGNVVNQVLYEYDTNGLLSKDFSNPSGAVNTASTPYIGYTYDTTKSGDNFTKRLRRTTMKYPSGKTLTYDYGTAGLSDDLFNRYSVIKEGVTSLVQYAFNGAVTPIKTTYPQPGLALDYTVSGTLDRFNRITDHAWKKGSTDVVRIQHGYDRVGNRLYRKDMVSTTNSELYGYDGVNQVKSLNRGTLNSTNNGITGSTFTESWNYDLTGNWLQYNKNGTVANRTYNQANEISGITHDKNGNITFIANMSYRYDAWNRLVEIFTPASTMVSKYSCNGLNHRVKHTTSNIAGGSSSTTFYFNENWQELESVTSEQTMSYVWGLRYIDDLVLRDKGQERLYSIADPNWNVVAITNVSGTVQQRMKYDGFGKVTTLDANFAPFSGPGFGWNRLFTGQVLSDWGLMLYRNRYYDTGLGRFVTRDPIGYEGKDKSLYRYVTNSPLLLIDPMGEQTPCNKCITPCEAYWGWWHGTHNGDQTYTQGPMIEAMKTHKGIDEIRRLICKKLECCCEGDSNDDCLWSGGNNYSAPLSDIPKFPSIIFDCSASDADFLRAAIGGFTRSWKVTSVDCNNSPKTATVEFTIENTAGMASLTRVPGIGSVLKNKNGPKPLKQTFKWTETISCRQSARGLVPG